MSLLVPDYSSSSDDDDAPQATPSSASATAPTATAAASVSAPAATAPPVTLPTPKASASALASTPSTLVGERPPTTKKTKRAKRKRKTVTLHLPPEIQRLLESGGVASDDSDDGGADSLLAKQKRARATAATKRTRSTDESASTQTLSFLPAPKNELKKPRAPTATATAPMTVPSEPEQSVAADLTGQDGAVMATALDEPDALTQATAASWDADAYAQYYQQYYYQQQQQQEQYYYAQVAAEAEANDDADHATGSSKRTRNRDRELERMLQQGQFAAVADKIVEVQGIAPNAWQPPPADERRGGGADGESELKVKASFWNTSAGTAVASVKPTRLHRQKHQLNQLAFDAKAREFDLLDRKGSALKTKRETHAKYGW